MSYPVQYTPSTITLFLIDSLMGKCHNMLIACTTVELKYYEEEYQRQLEAQHPFYLEQNQEAYIQRWEAAQRDYDAEIDEILNSQPGHDTILTGDSALDEEEEDVLDYCSEMDDCLIPYDLEPEDAQLNDEVLARIDFSEEINLNDLYP